MGYFPRSTLLLQWVLWSRQWQSGCVAGWNFKGGNRRLHGGSSRCYPGGKTGQRNAGLLCGRVWVHGIYCCSAWTAKWVLSFRLFFHFFQSLRSNFWEEKSTCKIKTRKDKDLFVAGAWKVARSGDSHSSGSQYVTKLESVKQAILRWDAFHLRQTQGTGRLWVAIMSAAPDENTSTKTQHGTEL